MLRRDAARAGGSEADSASRSPSTPPYADVLKDFKVKEGLIKLHEKDNHLYAELSSSQLNHDFIVLISIARGIGEGPLLGGMTWGFGDDWLWQFRKVGDNIQVVRRNVRFRAAKGSPEERAVHLAYTDSVLFALPILTTGPGGSVVIDLSHIFMSDLPQISQVLPGFSFSASKSSWAEKKAFADNVELEVAATYSSSGTQSIDTVPDSRGVSLNIHYSISMLPETGYTPRQADDRVGFFLTVVKDYSKKGDEDRFVRYINRWDLQKADPTAERSPPKKPIIFWIEKTVPFAYRAAIRDGILEWNKAFEEAGFVNAIEVRQQPDNADWDPEDINYNTFRWITAGAGFAMGPSRVNPLTGQILDADIIFDADFVTYWKQTYENFTPASIAAMTGGPLDLRELSKRALAAGALLRIGTMRGTMPLRTAYGHGPRVGLRLDGPGRDRAGRGKCERAREAAARGAQRGHHARSWPYAGTAAQLQRQHIVQPEGRERSGEDQRHRHRGLGDGLFPAEYRSQRIASGRLLLEDRRALRRVGDSVRFYTAAIGRHRQREVDRVEEDRLAPRRARLGLRHG